MTASSQANEQVTQRGPRVKVARLIDEYDLGGLGDQLIDRWTASADDRESLRALADRVNRRLLRAALESASVRPLESEVDAYLAVLTGDDVSSGERIDVERELERQGVDVESLTSDFVTHQAVYTYLTDYRGVSLEEDGQSSADRIGNGKRTIDRLQGRLSAVTESVIEQLRDSGHLTIGDFRMFTRIEIYCADCDTQLGAGELLSAGGCNCDDGTTGSH